MILVVLTGIIALSIEVQAAPEQWRREGWSATDFSKATVDLREIVSGGPPKDGIPAVDAPQFVPLGKRSELKGTEAVIGLEINGDARAYPLRILIWHEIVNDTVGGIPVAVTYCPLCNAAIVFERSTPHGILDFGTTGKLRHSDLIMYDRQTESWWQQFTGEAIAGRLAGSTLRVVPARLEAFGVFRQRSPEGRVLVPNDAAARDYGRNPYEGYDTSAVPFFYRGEARDGISPMARIVVVREDVSAVAVTLELLRDRGPLSIGDKVLSWSRGQGSALDHPTVAGGRDVGNVVVQRRHPDGHMVDTPYDVTFAFVFNAFHPDRSIIKSCSPEKTNALTCGALGKN